MAERVSVQDITIALLETKDALYLAPKRRILASGRASCLYFNVGDKVISQPDKKDLVVEALAQTYLKARIHSDRLIGVPDGMKNLTASVGDRLRIGQLSVREKQTDHGDQRSIEGSFEEGMGVAVFEDVMSTGVSIKLKAIEPVRAVGLIPTLVVTLIDRQYGGMQLMGKLGLPTFAFTNTEEIAQYLVATSALNDQQLRLLKEELEEMETFRNSTQ